MDLLDLWNGALCFKSYVRIGSMPMGNVCLVEACVVLKRVVGRFDKFHRQLWTAKYMEGP